MIRENRAECEIHRGHWSHNSQRCLAEIDPGGQARYEMYLEHVTVDPKKAEQDFCADCTQPVTDVRGPSLSDEPLDEQEQQIYDTYVADPQARGEQEQQIRLGYTGLAPDAPIHTNEQGGQQSKIEGRFDLIPPVAMLELAKIMAYGARRYAPNNWRKIPLDDHVNHMLMHLFAYVAGDRQDDHLGHALARAAMAVEISKLGEEKAA